MKRIIIFASGSGSNAENIVRYFQDTQTARVTMVLSNKKDAKVLARANTLKIEALYFNRTLFNNPEQFLKIIKSTQPDLIVLAGFLWKIPEYLVKAYPNKIINIHPALLPKYGGKGMYGMHVHQAVVNNKETETGITIHYVNEAYDEGAIIFQATCPVEATDTSEEVAKKIHALEYEHFPKVIDTLLNE
jgi:phosphoribosylglycinamide formyltransferase-1